MTPDPAAPPQLDLLPAAELVAVLLDGADRVGPAVRAAAGPIAAAAALLAGRISTGRWVFVGAGTSGRLAVGEAAELPGTFGLVADRTVGRLAGTGWGGDGDEDDEAAGRAAAADLTAADALVAVAASGRTPFTLAAAQRARAAGAAVVAVTTAPGSPLGRLADAAVEIAVGPEVLRGSTRMAAGTAQKVALNVLSTAAMALAGRVHGDLMIDVVPANDKLRLRAADIVAEIAGVGPGAAAAALSDCGGNARAAVLCLVSGLTPAAAGRAAAASRTLREALAADLRPTR